MNGRKNVHVKLKGLNRKKAVLADGSIVHYYYAWKGGPRIHGHPGDPEFLAAYHAAHVSRTKRFSGTWMSLLIAFQQSADGWEKLSERSKSDYKKHILTTEREFGDFPLSAMSDKRTRGLLMGFRDDLAKKSRRQADYWWQVNARILSWALNRGLIEANPMTKGGRLYRGSRVDKVWTLEDEKAFLASAQPYLQLPLMLAFWTGQRQGDLLALSWTQYDGTFIRFRQSKTGARVLIPVSQPLKQRLDAIRKREGNVLLTLDGKPWTSDGFRSSFKKAYIKAGLSGVTFNDMRGTAVTRLALAGCTEAEIATVTGHSLKDVRSILDSHYLHRDPQLAESAIVKLEEFEQRTKFPE
jgi:integrase